MAGNGKMNMGARAPVAYWDAHVVATPGTKANERYVVVTTQSENHP
jgi:hypothetical protein